ncbi:MAG TPA: hypothetical protein EYP19_13270, partial [Desulfobacterales bacterium]|nr:hypothetical protein [Desulfobacterales bacterium]
MFDELAEAECQEKIRRLEDLLRLKDDQLERLNAVDAELQNAWREKEQLEAALKERESELAFISKEMTEKERQVEQMKELAAHLEQRREEDIQRVEAEKKELHEQHEAAAERLRVEILDLEKKIQELQHTIASLRGREKEIL